MSTTKVPQMSHSHGLNVFVLARRVGFEVWVTPMVRFVHSTAPIDEKALCTKDISKGVFECSYTKNVEITRLKILASATTLLHKCSN